MRTKELPPTREPDLRGFYRLVNEKAGLVAEAVRFSDGRVAVLYPQGAMYPHASMAEAQRVHVGYEWKKVK